MSSFISVINVYEPIISLHGCNNFNNLKYKIFMSGHYDFWKPWEGLKKFLSGNRLAVGLFIHI